MCTRCKCVCVWRRGARTYQWKVQGFIGGRRNHRKATTGAAAQGRPLLQGALHHTHNAQDCHPAGANSRVGCVLVGVVMWGLASVDVRCVVGPNPNTNSDDVIIHRFDHSQPFRDSGTAQHPVHWFALCDVWAHAASISAPRVVESQNSAWTEWCSKCAGRGCMLFQR